MTILVGMVGSDGIILAADRRRVSFGGEDIDDQMEARKITHVEVHQVAYAEAGDNLTGDVGRELERSLDSKEFDFSNTRRSLQVMADRKMQEAFKKGSLLERRRTLLIVFYRNELNKPELWNLKISHGDSLAQPVDGNTIGGAEGNAARYFQRYYKEDVPIGDLMLLASHIVLSASPIDSAMIAGLDMMLFRGKEARFITPEEKATLRRRSEDLDRSIHAHIYWKRLLPRRRQ